MTGWKLGLCSGKEGVSFVDALLHAFQVESMCAPSSSRLVLFAEGFVRFGHPLLDQRNRCGTELFSDVHTLTHIHT